MCGVLRHLWLFGWLLALLAPDGARAQALLVDARPAIAVWPAVTLWADAPAGLDAAAVLAQPQRFVQPQGTPSNLGRSAQRVWLRIPLQVAASGAGPRVLEIDYPTLNQVELSLVRDGRVQAQLRSGNGLPLGERALPTRTLAFALDLAPGAQELLLQVHSHSSMVLPMTLRTPLDFTAAESRAQLVQGIVLGLALCMLIYSLAHWVSLGDRVFLDYALLLAGNTVFTLAYFGTGAQYLWPDWPALAMNVAPLAVLVTVAADARFMRATLAVQEIHPAIDRAMRLGSALALATLAAAVLDLLPYRFTQGVATVLGVLATVIVLPVAWVRARRGERTAAWLLAGRLVYMLGAVTTAALLRGHVEPGFWMLHVYPLSMLAEQAAWLAVLGLRVQGLTRSAERARLESESLRTLAHSDPLTGLPNRRGLQLELDAALPQCAPRQLLALYLLDLDGFKLVNDRWGHAVGDALLVAVGERLQAQLRSSDVVARLGGDEFVVLARGLDSEAAARALGDKLLAAGAQPYDAAGRSCRVGMTAGYALAPLDGRDARALLQRADAAMYAGKLAGRQCLQRALPEAATA